MGIKRVGRHPKEFREMAVARMKTSANITALCRELGIERRLLYKWRDQLQPAEQIGEPGPEKSEAELRRQVAQLKRLLADKAVEVDFFRGALQKIEARRRNSTQPGETASTTKSGS
ncbi:MAG TPA: transposase [Bryobacteraceae bacterium]|nr:transposase [Bryobacteraceae bacterium]